MTDQINRTHSAFSCARRLMSLIWLTSLMLLVGLTTGCARARAKTMPTLPPLEMPAPPPRIVLPMQAEVEPQEPSPVTEEPRRAQPAPARPRPATPAATSNVAEPPPAPVPPSTQPAAPPAPGTVLQTTPASEQGEVERAIRATMTRAMAELNRIDYRVLNTDARSQYDTAKRFVQQAEDAIRMKNLPFAKNLADKAAALAAQLGGNK
jgi:hypothetical protein